MFVQYVNKKNVISGPVVTVHLAPNGKHNLAMDINFKTLYVNNRK